MKNKRLPGMIGIVGLLVAIALAMGFSGTTAIAQSSEAGASKAKTEKALKDIKGSDKKGKFYFRKDCKSCHGKKGDGGELTPLSKTMKQWERYFRKNKHIKTKLNEEFDAVKLIHIKTFLINHAADSDQPETCG